MGKKIVAWMLGVSLILANTVPALAGEIESGVSQSSASGTQVSADSDTKEQSAEKPGTVVSVNGEEPQSAQSAAAGKNGQDEKTGPGTDGKTIEEEVPGAAASAGSKEAVSAGAETAAAGSKEAVSVGAETASAGSEEAVSAGPEEAAAAGSEEVSSGSSETSSAGSEETTSSDSSEASSAGSEETPDPEEIAASEEVEEELEETTELDAAVASGALNSTVRWELTGTGNALTLNITGSGPMYTMKYSYYWEEYDLGWAIMESAPWHAYRSRIKSVVISSGITSIETCAFQSCTSLETISIPNTVIAIGANAFRDSTLRRVVLPSSVVQLGNFAFRDCKELVSADLHAAKLTKLREYTFYGCEKLKYASLPETLTGYVGGNTFMNCYELESMVLPQGMTKIPSMTFANCHALKEVVIPSSVTEIEWAFGGCRSLSRITIPSGVTRIEANAFHHTSALESINIPDSLTELENYVFQASGLKSVTIPSSVTSIGKGTFSDCTSLTSVTIPSSVTSIGEEAFKGAEALPSLTIPSGVKTIGDRAFNMCYNLRTIYIPAGVTSIGADAFDMNYPQVINDETGEWDPMGSLDIYYGGTKAAFDKYGLNLDSRTITVHYGASENDAGFYNGVSYADVFDFDYYIAKYPDVKKAYGTNRAGALKHFVTNGMKEGRQGCADFDVISYRKEYRDLRKAYGDDLTKYYMHYINSGKADGRNGTGCTVLQNPVTSLDDVDYSAIYDYFYYTEKYPDVLKAYGLNDDKVLAHFVNNGLKEGRQGIDEASVPAEKQCKTVSLFRFYSSANKDHFYTMSEAEKNSLIAQNKAGKTSYVYEGVGWKIQTKKLRDNVVVYRFYDTKNKDHFYTINVTERNNIIANYNAGRSSYRYEGVGWYTPKKSGIPLYRFYNSQAKDHFYTTSAAEKASLIASWEAGRTKYQYEGIAWYCAE